MSNVLLLQDSGNTKEKIPAKIISIRFIPERRTDKEGQVSQKKEAKETILFYTKPIFKANKYEFF